MVICVNYPHLRRAAAQADGRLSEARLAQFKTAFTRMHPKLSERYSAQPVPDLDSTARAQALERIQSFVKIHGETLTRSVLEGSFNPFKVRADVLLADLLTDSGTSTTLPSQRDILEAWDATTPEVQTYAYARSPARRELNEAVAEVFGSRFILFPTLQGRAAEFLLLNALVASGLLSAKGEILSNKPFDTTKGHIQNAHLHVVSCTPLTTPQALERTETVFLGDIPLDVLETFFHEGKTQAVLITVTDNGGGGQPVSMENVKKVAGFARAHGLLVWIDACRIFENALLVQAFEKGFEKKTLVEIVQETLSFADVVTFSAKKMYAHSGGGILLNSNSPVWANADKLEAASTAIKELTTVTYGNGFDSYCGLTGRGMIEIVSGLLAATDAERIRGRIMQLSYASNALRAYKFPVVGGGHALYVAADQALPNVSLENCPAEYLQAIISAALGVRGCGLGSRLYGQWREGDGVWTLEQAPEMDSLRYAVPRETYSTELLVELSRAVGRAFSAGVFSRLHGGLQPVGFNTRGFYHFGSVYNALREADPKEFERAVREVRECI